MPRDGGDRAGRPGGACDACRRRSGLLAELGGPLDYLARDRSRLYAVLALGEEQLVQAVGGRRKAELAQRLLDPDADEPHEWGATVCSHHPRHAGRLRGASGAGALHLLGSTGTLARLIAAPVVAIVGSERASDYGVEMARSLARGLAVAGITVVGPLRDGIAAAAHAAVCEADGASVAVVDGGLNARRPARRQSLLERVAAHGCAVSELPPRAPARLWAAASAERIAVGVARLVIVVEATESQRDLAAARTAAELGRVVAAVPGRVTSPLSGGTNALLIEGAQLVRSAADALELLYPSGSGVGQPRVAPAAPPLPQRLRSILESVGAGWDTPERLAAHGVELADALMALSELELKGLLVRSDGGRYAPR